MRPPRTILSLIILLLPSLVMGGQEKYDPEKDLDHAKVHIRRSYRKEVPVYDRFGRDVVAKVKNTDDMIVGVILQGKTDDKYYVTAYDCMQDTVMVRGWIDKSIPLEADLQKDYYCWTLGEESGFSKPKVTFYYWIESFEVLDFDYCRLYGRFSGNDGDRFTGWVDPEYVCSNPFRQASESTYAVSQ